MIVEQSIAVPMRDGTVLRADVYRPQTKRPVAAVLNRTCYDRSFSLTPSAALDPELAADAGMALVCQDVRGQFSSDGDFYPLASERRDGYDTVEWVADQPWCSGAVVMAGRSYGGATQWLAAMERPPHLVAISPVVAGSDYFNGWIYQGGAFQLGFNLFWAQMMTAPRMRSSLGEQFRHLPLTDAPLLAGNDAARFYRDWLAHPTRDEYWEGLGSSTRSARVAVPALVVGGWYDVFLAGTLEHYCRIRDDGDSERARADSRLLIGPWAHGSIYGSYPDQLFDAFEGNDAINLAAEQISFFRRALGERPGEGQSNGSAEQPRIRLFVMGENRWRDEDDWPPRAREQRWYLHSDRDAGGHGGSLSLEAPGEEAPDRYLYDPASPAPTIGGPTSLPAAFLRTNSGPLDQRRVEERPDVLVYSSAVLADPVEVIGPLTVVLYASTSAKDTDFVAKLSDVDGDGHSRILAEGILRARYRESLERPVAIEPGRAYEYKIDLVATSNVFLPGHRVRLVVTSSSFPRFDRNPNTGNPFAADRAEDLVTAEQTIFHDAERPSHVVLPVVDR
jgi:uncharacterized protein